MPRPAYWLMKTEPACFSFEDLWASRGHRTGWSGVRNYQARNFMTKDMRVGDGVLVYHTGGAPPAVAGVAGLAEISAAARPDPTQFDPADEHFDPKSRREQPTWHEVEVRAVRRLPRFVPLAELREERALSKMALLRPGNRLSITPVTAAEWRAVLRLAGV